LFDELQDFKLIIHGDRVPQEEHKGQYNAPTIDEVAVLLVSSMQFYSYMFMVRKISLNHLYYYKTLFSRFAVDMMTKMITERLHFVRNHQKQLPADDYVYLRDAVNNDADINAGACKLRQKKKTSKIRFI
jgi:hypothetical protein